MLLQTQPAALIIPINANVHPHRVGSGNLEKFIDRYRWTLKYGQGISASPRLLVLVEASLDATTPPRALRYPPAVDSFDYEV